MHTDLKELRIFFSKLYVRFLRGLVTYGKLLSGRNYLESIIWNKLSNFLKTNLFVKIFFLEKVNQSWK